MPIKMESDHKRNLTTFSASGELTYAEQIAALQEFYGTKPTVNVLWDFRAITGNRISSRELGHIIAFVKENEKKRPAGKTALVASTDAHFGLARMSEIMAEGEGLPWAMRAFRSIERAFDWIDETET